MSRVVNGKYEYLINYSKVNFIEKIEEDNYIRIHFNEKTIILYYENKDEMDEVYSYLVYDLLEE